MQNYIPFSDEYFINEALKEANYALSEDEIPVGAVIVVNNQIIAKAYNLTEKLNDTTAHAEMQAITSASEYLGAKYLKNATLFVTLEPCLMCMGALYWSKISRIVYGASDSKRGFYKFENILNKNTESLVHPKTEITSGVLEKECSILIKDFFRKKRKINKKY